MRPAPRTSALWPPLLAAPKARNERSTAQLCTMLTLRQSALCSGGGGHFFRARASWHLLVSQASPYMPLPSTRLRPQLLLTLSPTLPSPRLLLPKLLQPARQQHAGVGRLHKGPVKRRAQKAHKRSSKHHIANQIAQTAIPPPQFHLSNSTLHHTMPSRRHPCSAATGAQPHAPWLLKPQFQQSGTACARPQPEAAPPRTHSKPW